MEQQYTFDPCNWATIAPSFEALIDAPRASDGFLVWLRTWNGLEVAVHDAWTQLKRPAYYDTRDRAAEQAYQVFTEHMFSTYLGLTNRLIDRALAVQPDPPTPQFRQLWRRWQNQRTLFAPASLPLQAEISRVEGQYREIMRNYKAADDDPLAYWMERRTELNDLMLLLLRLRRQLAHVSGEPTFLVYRWRELNRLDYTIAECQAFHRAVEHIVVPAVQQLRSHHAPEQLIPDLRDLDALTEGVERILSKVDPTFGAVFHQIRAGYLDLGDRPGKAPAVEEWFFPGAGLPYLHVASRNPASILHESGHGMHDYLSFRTQGSLWNSSGPEEFQEFAAIALEMLCWPLYAREHGGWYTADEATARRRATLTFYLDAMTSSVREDAFEHWVYGQAPEDVTAAELDAKWLELSQRYTPWETSASAAEAASGWQRWTWSLFRMPLYMITYPTAIVATCQFGRLAATDRTSAIENYTAALAIGNTRPLPELFRIVEVAFPFSNEVVTRAVDFVRDQWARTASG